jgi:tRNA(His) 5'-end guanylyltransferase
MDTSGVQQQDRFRNLLTSFVSRLHFFVDLGTNLETVHKAMLASTKDLVQEFNCSTAYTESDEITLIFPPAPLSGQRPILFNGKIAKIISLTASLCSARFNFHLNQLAEESSISPKVIII